MLKILIAIGALVSSLPLLGQYYEAPWTWNGHIEPEDPRMLVHIDDDEIFDILMYDKPGDVITAARWERHTPSHVGLIRNIDLPDFPVWSMGAIDFDQDGDGDLLYTHRETGLLYVSIQSCPFHFEEAIRVESTTAEYGSFKVHDANGDGIDDLVGKSFDTPFTFVMQLGLGDGEFGPARTRFSGYQQIFAERYQDLDGDGFTDLTITTGSGSRIVYYPGQESGGWGSERTVITGVSNPWGSAIGDIDGDGHNDVIVASFTGGSNPILIAHNNGDNTFTKETLISGVSSTSHLACADLNGDGLYEILVSAANDQDTWLYRNKGDFEFDKSRIWEGFRGIGQFTDVDGDGNLDITVRDLNFSDENHIFWWRGNASGSSFTSRGTLYPRYAGIATVLVGDFDQDRIPDMVFKNIFEDASTVWFSPGRGDGSFGVERNLFDASTGQFSSTDFNRDGKNDLVFIENKELKVSLNQGNAVFSEPAVLRDDSRIVYPVDAKGDKATDYIIVDDQRDTLDLLSFEPDGTSYEETIETGTSFLPTVSDFNGDGNTDFALFDYGDKSLSIYINRDGQFDQVYIDTINTVQFIYLMEGMDYDLDGVNDIILAIQTKLHWMRGDENGGFADPEPLSVTESVGDIHVLDLVGDEAPELYTGGNTTDDGYYSLIGPMQLSNKRQLLFDGESVRTFSELNLSAGHEVLVERGNRFSWWVEGQDTPYPYVIIEQPCDGQGNGTVKVVTDCDDEEIKWADGSTGNFNYNLSPGQQSYVVVAGQDTVAEVSFELTQSSSPVLQADVVPDNGSSSGAIALSIEGEHGPYLFTWDSSNGESGNDTTGLMHGTYFFTITDAIGCSYDTVIIVPLVSGSLNINSTDKVRLYPTITDDGCFLESDGAPISEVTVIDVHGRVCDEIFHMDNHRVWLDLTHVAAGMYVVLVRSETYSAHKVIKQ